MAKPKTGALPLPGEEDGITRGPDGKVAHAPADPKVVIAARAACNALEAVEDAKEEADEAKELLRMAFTISKGAKKIHLKTERRGYHFAYAKEEKLTITKDKVMS